MQKAGLLIPIIFLILAGCGQTNNVDDLNVLKEEIITNDYETENNDMKAISADEVAMHSSESDCWVIIDDKVYDVTDAIAGHPGGPQSIIGTCGADATESFTTRNKPVASDHPLQAYDSLEELYVGNLK